MGLYTTYNQAHKDLDKTLLTKTNIGSNSQVFSETGTGLITPIAGTENLTEITEIGDTLKVKTTVLTGQANGEVIREIEYTNGSGVYAREILPDTTKNDTLEIEITSTFVHDIN